MSRITDRNDWFELWYEDKQSIMDTMVKNMVADLNAGYDYFGKSIQDQKQEIKNYKSEFDKQMIEFATMDEKAANRWCFYDLKRRGAII
jgi:hypothetical protein